MKPNPTHLVLASASPRRSELLRRMGLQFEVRPSDIEEDDSGRFGPKRMVAENASRKAIALSEQVLDALVLGSDTTVAIDDRILSKPEDLDEARTMLSDLSGRTHVVYTAVSLHWKTGGLTHDFVETSEVTFKVLNDVIISEYFKRMNPLDKAGAYGIQEESGLIIESFRGSIENVMGLPIQSLETCFMELGFDFSGQS